MSKSPFIPKARSYRLLSEAVWATIQQGDDLWTEDGRRAVYDAEQWISLLDDLQAGTIGLDQFKSQAENLPWLGHAAHDAFWAFAEYETQREVWGRYKARLAREKAAHRADTTSLGDLLQGALQMARESRHAA